MDRRKMAGNRKKGFLATRVRIHQIRNISQGNMESKRNDEKGERRREEMKKEQKQFIKRGKEREGNG